ncbi:MAG: ZIP family metal transporter [Bacilli bacterium]|nr:ZIP family metal transporter [Bacilli bacterium]
MSKNKVEKGKLYFLGVISMISLLLHNIPEGIISCITTNYNLNLGLKITTSIIIHNIPEGILIALPIYFSTKSRKRASIYVFIAAIGEPLGAFFSLFLLKNKINDVSYIGYIFISVALLMILIAVEEIFPKIKDKNKKYITVGLSIGLIIFLINKLII